MSKKYNIQFLEDKFGRFDKEDKYPRTSLIEGPLIYIEKSTKIELENEIKNVKEDEYINPTYIWGYVLETGAIYVTRTFGENKVFIYNPTSMKKTEYVKGKLKVLKNLDTDTIDDLFDQKAVFDYFYKKLWDLRLELGKEIASKNKVPDNIALMEAQHIVDRIIFTYFICEKGLVSVKEYGPISGKELFSDILGQLPETWQYLKQLFFNQFAKENANDLDCGGEVFIKTPYLNGGLFRPKLVSGISEEHLHIEYDWDNIFSPLNKYSWIIEDEITDLEGEYEGNLTPEIIGHIYEKFAISIGELDQVGFEELKISNSGDLKRGNKKIGAYYTPEQVTEYISKNTIVPYLIERIGLSEIKTFQEFLDVCDTTTLNMALNVLNEIKICDPACGSGAFIIKAGEVLLEYKLLIQKKLGNSEIDRYKLKKDIIIHNLHGVDIQENAVEICKLRLWLWLISSATNIKVEPLPNIEYNFVFGNSLVGWNNEKFSQDILLHVDENSIRPLITLKSGYEAKQKEIIDNAIELLRKTNIKSYARAISLLKSLYSYSEGENAEILKEVIVWTRSAVYSKINGVFHDNLSSKGCKISFEQFEELEPLHWYVDFREIFDNGGFDIIIENPPYISFGLRGVGKLPPYLKDFYKKEYVNSAEYKISIYSIFFNRTIDLLKDGGYCGLITPDSFLLGMYYSKIRKYILEKTSIKEFLFAPFPIFVGVTVGTSVISTLKKDLERNKNEMIQAKLSKTMLNFTQNDFESFSYPQDYFEKMVYNRFRLFFNVNDFEIVSLIETSADYELKKYLTGHTGVRSRTSQKNIVSKEKSSKNWKKGLLSSAQIKRYKLTYNGDYIHIKAELLFGGGWDKNVVENPKILIRQTGDGIIANIDNQGFYHLNNLHSFSPNNKDVNLYPLLAILNSNLYKWYYRKISLEEGRTMAQTDIESLEKLPIKYDQSIWQYLEFICKILMKLGEGPVFEYLDNEILDKLIYELYLNQKFKKDGITTNLENRLRDHFFDIDSVEPDKQYDAIEKFYNEIKMDKNIKAEIKAIKSHSWIKIIENTN